MAYLIVISQHFMFATKTFASLKPCTERNDCLRIQSFSQSPSTSVYHTYLHVVFSAAPSKLSCTTFKNFKILQFVSLFLSSWGSSRKARYNLCQARSFPPFTRWGWITCSLKFVESWLNQNINITRHSPPHNANLRNQSNIGYWWNKVNEEWPNSSKYHPLSKV